MWRKLVTVGTFEARQNQESLHVQDHYSSRLKYDYSLERSTLVVFCYSTKFFDETQGRYAAGIDSRRKGEHTEGIINNFYSGNHKSLKTPTKSSRANIMKIYFAKFMFRPYGVCLGARSSFPRSSCRVPKSHDISKEISLPTSEIHWHALWKTI